MTEYTYKAFDEKGIKITGQIKGNNKEEIKDYLFNKKYVPIEIKKLSKLNMDLNDVFKKKLEMKN